MKRVALMVLALSTSAFAQSGALISPSELSPQIREQLKAEIDAAKKTSPGAFQSVEDIRANMATIDARKRGGVAPVALLFKPMGAQALWALVEHAAFNSPPRGELSQSAWTAWQMGLLEAIGVLRDARTLPVFAAALKPSNALADNVARAAAQGLARLGTEDAAQLLVKLSSDSVRGRAVQSAMGSCRRLVVAQALSALADGAKDEEHARIIAKQLGEVGNSWAWKTPAMKLAAAEEGAVRQVAAEALLRIFVRFEGLARQAASNALMVVDAPTTSSLIAASSREATGDTKTALAKLADRFERNPTR